LSHDIRHSKTNYLKTNLLKQIKKYLFGCKVNGFAKIFQENFGKNGTLFDLNQRKIILWGDKGAFLKSEVCKNRICHVQK